MFDTVHMFVLSYTVAFEVHCLLVETRIILKMAGVSIVEDLNKSKECGVKDPYAYLDRKDFTSEKYKIEIRGLPKYYGIGELKKFLNDKLELGTNKVKPPKRGSGWVYVCFRSEESREHAITIINGLTWKNSKLTAQAAKPAPDPFIKRRNEARENSSKRLKTEEDEETLTPAERVKNSTTPLWNVPYQNQLEIKVKDIKSVLMRMGQELLRENKGLSQWVDQQKSSFQGLPCKLLPILSADVTDGYRNKCEFTVGKSWDGNQIMIGFRLSSYAAGSTAVGPIDELCHIPERMKSAVKILEEFIRTSELTVFNPVDHSGYWRQITARTTRLDHLMLIVGINPQDLKTEDLSKLKNEIRDFFETGNGKRAQVTSLYFQTIGKKETGGEGGGTIEHLSGSEHIEESLLGMTFRVSPQAFFQVNTCGAEVLYKAAIDLAEPNEETALLDVCCGTGTIGLCFAKHCGEVLGLEMIGDAIKDAKVNVVKNGITNCEFFIGKAEDILIPVIHRTTKPDIIAIVDPPRAGLHQRALLALRKAKKLRKVIYISCDPKAAVRNLVDLARPSSKLYQGEPLVAVKAVPVDMFPHTKHCELIVQLERLSEVMKSTDV
ncbi:tRNA (uracil-5-)-methyltransferase homolog A-like [Venturia canescens]|uniref:tRNA (uracil-5-)-methyltransferase homolog A-like n=1 Tax=Venturia canescens TaxID=32260 RepID=UPI001C9D43B9|nr:tRNA (uracil-5-)-methyltransferase homolog A-like [Venturia canescens]XP_043267394.1 tRNA (uracil-5-)-methyltransferase homolog A-like [Venturia canescens]